MFFDNKVGCRTAPSALPLTLEVVHVVAETAVDERMTVVLGGEIVTREEPRLAELPADSVEDLAMNSWCVAWRALKPRKPVSEYSLSRPR